MHVRTAIVWAGVLVGFLPLPAIGQALERRAVVTPAADCGVPVVNRGTLSRLAPSPPWSCEPAYDTSTFAPPKDDSIALESLLEAAGLSEASAAANPYHAMVAGHFCGAPAQKEIFLSEQTTSGPRFALLGGPTPHLTAHVAPVLGSWRAIAAGVLVRGADHEQIVLASSSPSASREDLTVVDISTVRGTDGQPVCGNTGVVASIHLGIAGVTAVGAVGAFDGTSRRRIAVLDRASSTVYLLGLEAGALTLLHTQKLDDAASGTSDWRVMAAGDLDHDGADELIAARYVKDHVGDTIVAYRWVGSQFVQVASAKFGNNSNSEWSAATAGDFNGDGRAAVVLAKTRHSFFSVVDWDGASPNLTIRTTADLDSASGQDWAGLAATDWLGGDQGAAELIAFRKVSRPYRTNLFVYGNAFHRAARDSALDETRSQWVQHLSPGGSYFMPAIDDLKRWIRETHTNVFNWFLDVQQNADMARGLPFTVHDYPSLVSFLTATRDWGVDGRQLRVWVTVSRPSAASRSNCSPTDPPGLCSFESCAIPEDTRPMTSWNALDYFKADFLHDYAHLDQEDLLRACRDLVAWSAVLSRLAQDFPHLVAFGIDDASDSLDSQPSSDCTVEFQQRQAFGEDCIAAIEAALRTNAPWMNFVPTIYYSYQSHRQSDWADLPLTLDSMQFYFRNEKDSGHECINNSLECTRTVANAAGEIRDMQRMLPSGRKLQVGTYFVGCAGCGNADSLKFKPPRIRYDYELVRTARNLPEVGGVTAYGLQTPPWIPQGAGPPDPENGAYLPCSGSACTPQCSDYDFLTDTMPPGDAQYQFWMWGTDRYCALQRAFGARPQRVHHTDLTPTGPPAAGDPVAFTEPADGTKHAFFRGPNGHLHELWWTDGAVGQGDLTPAGPAAADDPAAYFLASDNSLHVIYRSANRHVRELQWIGPSPAARRDLTPTGALADGRPAVFFDTADGTQQVIFHSTDGHLRELWWTGSPVGQGDLTPAGPAAADDPAAYFVPSNGSAHVIYRSADGHVRELVWTGPSPAARRDLTPDGAAAVGRPAAFQEPASGMQHVVFRSSDGQLHELWWTSGPIGQGPLIPTDVAPAAASDPAAYFVAATGTSHVVYRGTDNHVHELFWTHGVVSHNDLTELADAPTAVGVPFAYFTASDHTHRVYYRGADGHTHELSWSD